MAINWGAARNGQNDLFQYFQMGQQIGQGIVDQKVNKALGNVMMGGGQAPAPQGAPQGGTPAPVGMTPGIGGPMQGGAMSGDLATIARYRPELIPQIQKRQQEQAAQQREAEERKLMGDALTNPDPAARAAARQRVAYFNSDMYMKLGDGEKKKVDDMMGVIAQQAFSILPLPPEQPSAFKLTGNATQDLKMALAAAGQLDDFEKFQQPDYMPVSKDQDLVNTRDPAAVAQFARGAGGNIPSPKSKAERDALPAGAKYYDPEGNLRTKAGGPTPAASGGFPGQ